MFDLALNASQERLRAELQKIAVERLRPLSTDAEAKRVLPSEVSDTLAGLDWLPGSDAFRAGVDDPLSFALAAEALAWGDPAMALGWVTSRQVAWLIAANGTEEQKQKYLPRLAKSPLAPASLLFFEGYGRGPSELETSARRNGANWVIDGEKTAVVFAGSAEVSIVVARDENGELIAFVLDNSGTAVRFEGTEDRRVALGALPFATSASIRGLEVAGSAVLGREGLATTLSVVRLAQAAVSLGAAEASTRYAADWGLNREAFGRPLIGFQGVSFVLADLFMEIETARLALWKAITTSPESGGTTEAGAELWTSRTVAQINQLFRNAAREGIELMGVHGVISDHPAERVYRSAGVLAGIDFDPLLAPLVLGR